MGVIELYKGPTQKLVGFLFSPKRSHGAQRNGHCFGKIRVADREGASFRFLIFGH